MTPLICCDKFSNAVLNDKVVIKKECWHSVAEDGKTAPIFWCPFCGTALTQKAEREEAKLKKDHLRKLNRKLMSQMGKGVQ
jgi:hypothetical protein